MRVRSFEDTVSRRGVGCVTAVAVVVVDDEDLGARVLLRTVICVERLSSVGRIDAWDWAFVDEIPRLASRAVSLSENAVTAESADVVVGAGGADACCCVPVVVEVSFVSCAPPLLLNLSTFDKNSFSSVAPPA